MNFPNYRNFYQKALILIGSNDHTILNGDYSAQVGTSTHWLIALEGEIAPQAKEYYYWKVNIYPSNSEGTFDYLKPFLTTILHDSIDKAIESARRLELHGHKGELCSPDILEKIS